MDAPVGFGPVDPARGCHLLQGRTHRAIVVLFAALLLAACGGGDGETPSPPTEQEEAAPPTDIELTGTADFRFAPSDVEAAAGTIGVTLVSTGGPHTFTLELEEGDDTVAQVFTPGEPNTGEVELEAGTYTFYCSIPGHREQGMEGTLTVS